MIERCERYFQSLDEIIGELVALAGPDAAVVLASDHGFGPTSDVFHVNSWLERRGLLHWAEGGDGAAPRGGTEVGFAEMTRHVHALDWSRTLAYAATPSSQGINVVSRLPGTDDPLPRRPAAGPPWRSRRCARSAAARRPAARRGGVDPRGRLRRAVRGDRAGPLARAGRRRHGFDPALRHARGAPRAAAGTTAPTASSSRGAGHPAGSSTGALPIVDVAPLCALHLMGLPAPDDMDGRVPVEIFRPEEVERRPPRRTAAQPPAALNVRSTA